MTKEELIATAMTKEELLARIAQIQALAPSMNKFTALVMGRFGTGKTRLLGTARKPILIDSFDPGGTVVLRDLIKAGDVVLRDYSRDDPKNPDSYKRWEKQWEDDLRTGFLKYFGTYSIDTLTTWIDSASTKVAKDKGREDNLPKLPDYPIIINMCKNMIKLTSAEDCDFILTAHLEAVKDEITGEIREEVATYPSLRPKVPALFTEKWVMITKDKPGGCDYKILTKPRGRYQASTQLGKDDIFAMEEVPDIKTLLKKAGLPTDDKVWR